MAWRFGSSVCVAHSHAPCIVSEKNLSFDSVKCFNEASFQPNRGAKTNLQLAFEVLGPTHVPTVSKPCPSPPAAPWGTGLWSRRWAGKPDT